MYPSHELGPIPDATDALRDQICNLMPAENLIPERDGFPKTSTNEAGDPSPTSPQIRNAEVGTVGSLRDVIYEAHSGAAADSSVTHTPLARQHTARPYISR